MMPGTQTLAVGGDTAGVRRARRDIDGIVLLDKPLGLTSNQALQRVRWLFAARKGGHTGSLDPLASGMLPICLGQATKISAFLLDSNKVYRVRLCFGSQTATGDMEGPVIGVGAAAVGQPELQRVLEAFRGPVSQVPPMYSALKHQGRRLYELARAGQEVPRAPRIVTIHELLLESFHPKSPVLRVHCEKGTYIRTLVEDIARAAGTVAHVVELRRLAVEPFPESAMCSLEDLEVAGTGPGALERFLLPADEAVRNWPAVRFAAPEALRIRHGQSVAGPPGQGPGMVRLYDELGRFLGVGECLPDLQVRSRRLMAEPASAGKT